MAFAIEVIGKSMRPMSAHSGACKLLLSFQCPAEMMRFLCLPVDRPGQLHDKYLEAAFRMPSSCSRPGFWLEALCIPRMRWIFEMMSLIPSRSVSPRLTSTWGWLVCLANVKWKGYFIYGLIGLAQRVWLFPPSPLSGESQKQKTEGATVRGPQDR